MSNPFSHVKTRQWLIKQENFRYIFMLNLTLELGIILRKAQAPA